jgi:hypothetical protein
MTPQFVLNPSDLGRALDIARKFGSPVKLPARLLGLGADEQRVPTWAWLVVAFGAGAIASAVYWPRVREFLESPGFRR